MTAKDYWYYILVDPDCRFRIYRFNGYYVKNYSCQNDYRISWQKCQYKTLYELESVSERENCILINITFKEYERLIRSTEEKIREFLKQKGITE